MLRGFVIAIMEKLYQRAWCADAGGVIEYALEDRTRVDCLTDEYAVEVDFAAKWAEAVGQALYYGLATGRKPAVLLIIERPVDTTHLKRIKAVSEKTGLTVWTISTEDLGSAVTTGPTYKMDKPPASP
jgi:hypothetical protein